MHDSGNLIIDPSDATLQYYITHSVTLYKKATWIWGLSVGLGRMRWSHSGINIESDIYFSKF